MAMGSRVIVALSLLTGVAVGVVSAIDQYSAAKAFNAECQTAQASWDSDKTAIDSAKGKQPWEMTDKQLLAVIHAQNTLPLSRPECAPVKLRRTGIDGLLAVLATFIVTFITCHVAWLIGRAYNKLMRKLS